MSEVESRGRTERERPRSAGERGKLHERKRRKQTALDVMNHRLKKANHANGGRGENLISSRQEINHGVWFSA